MEKKRHFFRVWMAFICLLAFALVHIPALASSQPVTVRLKNSTLHDLIWELEKQTQFEFIYNTDQVKAVKVDHITVENVDALAVLGQACAHTGLTFELHNGVVIIKPELVKESASAQAQETLVVKGTVKDNYGEPLPGVSILLKGTKTITTTNADGNFEIKVPADSDKILIFTFIGMESKELSVPLHGAPMQVVLRQMAEELEQVVVTGYGSFKKSSYSGSASVIKTEKLADVPVLSVNDLLLGSAAGVTVSTGSSNVPGAPSSIRIRGVGSFNADKSPLYVIDGVPVMSSDVSTISSTSTAGLDIMSSLNTSDIENIAVIKDAAAASLYGSRAANGVILITTKSGKKGKPAFSLKADMGFSDFAMDYRTVMNGQQRRDLISEGLVNEYLLKGKTAAEAAAYAQTNIDKYAPVPWCGFVNWDDVLFKRGTYQNYEASLSGGGENIRFFSSINYTDQNGTTQNSGLKRITGRVNIDYDVTKKFSMGVKALFSDIHQDVYSEGTTYTSPFYSSRNAVVPSDPVYLEDGSYNRSFLRNSDRNPKLSMDYNYKVAALTRMFNTVYGQYEFIPDLKLRTTYSYDYNLSNGDTYADPRTSDGRTNNGERVKTMTEYKKWVWSNSLGYSFNFLTDHSVDALVAFDLESFRRDYLSGGKWNFAIPDLDAIGNGSTVSSVNGSPDAWRMASFISRLNYAYKSKYYLGGSFRTDGTSRLSREDNSRWGNFWSVSGSWRISEEGFMENLKHTISDLRYRISYGVNGTQPPDYYGYYGLSSLSSLYAYMSSPGLASDQIANADLQWETNYNLSTAIEVGLFNRLNFTVEYYNRVTKNLLMDFAISRTTGFTDYLRNVGEMQNQGVEFEITSRNIEGKDFRWTTSFNISHNKNKITKWDGQVSEQVSGNLIRRVGLPFNTFYLYEFAGIDPNDGAPQFYSNIVNNDTKVVDRSIVKDYTKAVRIATKGPDPVVYGGLTNIFSYKWIDLSFLVNYAFGGYSYDNGAQKAEHGGSDLLANMPVYYSQRWQNPGDVTDIERFVANRSVSMASIASTRRLHSSDFVRLKNLTFGVKLPEKWIKRINLSQVRVYCSGNNLLTWAAYDAYDPEAMNAEGYVEWTQPPLKTWTFGIDIKF